MLQNIPALAISILTHLLVLLGLAWWKHSLPAPPPELLIETVITEERPQEEFVQEMSIHTEVSQTLSVTAGGVVTGQIGSTNANPIDAQNIEVSDALKEPRINIKQFARISTPGLGDLNVDLGEGEVSGETGARVEGYGAAMHRLTQELRRMMRRQRVLVVWLFDASNSLKDDRREIQENFHKVYEELEIARRQDEKTGQKHHLLETMICSYGAKLEKLLPNPTADLKQIKSAIGQVQDDESGKEMTFSSIRAVVDEYGRMAAATNRKLAVVVLTDETGDDVEQLEKTIVRCKLYKSPVYFLGREAIFGYPYTYVRWRHKESGRTFSVRVDRGPETAMPECLQYNGFGGRRDGTSSGFAPYAQARLVKESGGIFFLLQTKEKDLGGRSVYENLTRKFDDIRMKQYEPNLTSVREYVTERNRSEFRDSIWKIILRLNPHLDNELNLAWGFPMDHDRFRQKARGEFNRGVRALDLMNKAIKKLEEIRPQRDLEKDPRWRAAYDLVYAQLLAIRVRVFQFLLALDHHVETKPLPKNPKANGWHRVNSGQLLKPSDKQVKQTGVDLKELELQRKRALDMFARIIEEHPGTPWAQRAEQERRWAFGIRFVGHFYDPKYYNPQTGGAKITVPNF